MPKNIFTLSVFALPAYTLMIVVYARACHGLLRSVKPRFLRVSLPVLLVILTVHVLPLLSFFYLNEELQLAAQHSSDFPLLLVTYGWVAALVISGQAAVYYIPAALIVRLRLFNLREKLQAVFPSNMRSGLVVALLTVTAIYSSIRITQDALNVNVDRIPLPVLSDSSGVKEYRIAVFADLQLDAFTHGKRVDTLVSMAERLSPDLVLFAGDYITIDKKYLPEVSRELQKLAPDGTGYAVLGDHDFWTDYDSSVSTLKNGGVTLGEDTLVYVPMGRDTLNLFLITNCLPDRIWDDELEELMTRPRKAGPSLLLVHDAKYYIIDSAVKHDIDIIVAGHTHGSQIALDFFGYNLTGLLMESPYVSGTYHRENMLIYVCNGLGMSVAPLRYNVTPSMGLISLTAK